MKIYLAGKIARNDWRHDIVDSDKLAEGYNYSSKTIEWPTVPIRGTDLTYVGPYFQASGHGLSHEFGHHGTESARRETAQRCRQAIRDCDVFFAWLECETAHGTMVEIGYAYALGKNIIIAHPPKEEKTRTNCEWPCSHWPCGKTGCNCADRERNELWFALEHATAVINGENAVAAFKVAAAALNEVSQHKKCESPLEELFYTTLLACSPAGDIRKSLQGLVVQHAITVNGQNYRLDFALPGKKIAFEMDGYTYHGKERGHFNRDRRRDLNLKLAGWEIHRFDGDMIRDDVVHVLEIAAKLADAR